MKDKTVAAHVFENRKAWEAFCQFTGLLYPELVEEQGGTIEAAFDNIDSFRGTETGRNLRRALDHLLDDGLTDREIEEAWHATSPVYSLSGEGAHRIFLEACRTYLKTGSEDAASGLWRSLNRRER